LKRYDETMNTRRGEVVGIKPGGLVRPYGAQLKVTGGEFVIRTFFNDVFLMVGIWNHGMKHISEFHIGVAHPNALLPTPHPTYIAKPHAFLNFYETVHGIERGRVCRIEPDNMFSEEHSGKVKNAVFFVVDEFGEINQNDIGHNRWAYLAGEAQGGGFYRCGIPKQFVNFVD